MKAHSIRAAEIEPVRQFLCANGWAHRVGNAEQFSELLRNSQRTAVAAEGGVVIGFARGITDGFSNGYLSMVAVSPDHQRQGIGRALVHHVMGDNDGITWALRAGRTGAADFFKKLGFTASSAAMERSRK